VPDVPGDLAPLIERAARAHGVDGALLAAIATAQCPEWAEPCAPALMQLMPATLRRLGVADILDPAQVIDAGARHLRGQIEAFDGDLYLAVAAYHAGPDAVRRHGGVPPYWRTQAFVPMVMAYLAEFRSAGAPGGVRGSTTDREGRC
jgi:soluble lytic murein transglycosylase-like protein